MPTIYRRIHTTAPFDDPRRFHHLATIDQAGTQWHLYLEIHTGTSPVVLSFRADEDLMVPVRRYVVEFADQQGTLSVDDELSTTAGWLRIVGVLGDD